jgi:mycothiol system anti-sigma-R factor
MHQLISCASAVERLWAYLDRELDDEDKAEVEAHLAFCRRCCGELEFAKHLRRFLADQEDERMPAAMRSRLDRFIDGLCEPAEEGDT